MKKTQAPLPVHAIVLAAGQGKRMHSNNPKVLVELAGKPLLFHILDRFLEVRFLGRIGIVVGFQKEKVIDAVKAEPRFKSLKVDFLEQREQLGTGHALISAMDTKWGTERFQEKGFLLVLPGDLPLISSDLIRGMTEDPTVKESVRLLTCRLDNPFGYGRVVRRGTKGKVLRITEEKDATDREKDIQEVATSIYLFQLPFLRANLRLLNNVNAQKEYYLTDLISMASRRGSVEVFSWEKPEELRGINNALEWSEALKILRTQTVRKWALRGVRFWNLDQVSIDDTVTLAPGCEIGPNVQIFGSSKIAAGVRIESGSVLRDVEIGEGVTIKAGCYLEKSKIENNVILGPYAHLRPGSKVGQGTKIGNFVELKETVIGRNTSVAHLSYLGDAKVGDRVNIGCGFITCNFDGRTIDGKRKHPTVIEDDAFIGSDCQAVAPVKIGKGAFVASGSTITEDVDADAMAIARSRQVNKPGYAKKLK